MNEERNALSELARDLGLFADMNRMADRANGGIISKAKRIIEEIAGVPDVEVKEQGFKSYMFPSRVMSAEAVNMCRAIAGQSTKRKDIDDDERIARDRRELVEKSRETIKALNMVIRHESCPILSHSLAEVKHDLAWCEKTFAEEGAGK